MRRVRTEGGAETADTPVPAAPAEPADPIGERLRGMFEAVEAAPVPEEITRLVEALERKRTGRRRRPSKN